MEINVYGHKELHGKPADMNVNDDNYVNFILMRSEEINAKNKCTFFAFIFFIPALVAIYEIHIFIITVHLHLCRLHYLTTNQFHDQLPALHRYRRDQDSNPGKPDFFQAFFS